MWSASRLDDRPPRPSRECWPLFPCLVEFRISLALCAGEGSEGLQIDAGWGVCDGGGCGCTGWSGEFSTTKLHPGLNRPGDGHRREQTTPGGTNQKKQRRRPEKGQASDRCSLRRGMHDRCRAVEGTAEADRVGATKERSSALVSIIIISSIIGNN